MKVTAKLMYGLPYSEIEDKDRACALIESKQLDVAIPYEDAPTDEWFIGVQVEGDGAWFLLDHFIDKAVLKFMDFMNVDGSLKAVPHVAS